ncbi:hypothetical protein [Rhodoferax sp.]|uniref:hypothetical protein n=1 Tax=Rhodoferax sp. TaxID=50421 RepID=UPI00374CE056
MVGVSATLLSAIPNVPSAPDKSRVVQARRDAEQAQATADDLRRQADTADRNARNSQDKADDLRTRSKELDSTYERQLRGNSQSPGRLINLSA